MCSFLTFILQGSVATRLKWDGIRALRDYCWVWRWKIVKIGPHLPKLWYKNQVGVFSEHITHPGKTASVCTHVPRYTWTLP